MANPQKRKGDAAEREAAQLLSDLLGLVVRRKLGAGRTTTAGGDTGDLDGVPAHVIQVASWANTAAAARLKPDEAGGTWRVVLTPEQWAAYVRLILRQSPQGTALPDLPPSSGGGA